MNNIRPFQLPQDLETMRTLVNEGFQYPENPSWSIQEDERQGMLDTLNGARRIWPVVRAMQALVPVLRDIFRGFIYEVDGNPAGLINFFRRGNAPEWMIANVTVLPKYRRRGIARDLVAATLDELRRRKATLAKLEVIADNCPAYALYQDLGFDAYSSSSQYDFEGSEALEALPLPQGYSLRPIGRGEWKVQYALMQRITPAEIALYEPVKEENFRVPLVGQMLDLLMEAASGVAREQFAVFSESGETQGIGSFRYRRRPGGVNSAWLQLDPGHPELAESVVRSLLSSIQKAAPGRRTELDLKDWQPAVLQAAERFGCKKRYTYCQMAIRLS